MSLLKYNRLDLPIYPVETMLSPQQLSWPLDDEPDEVIRRITICAPGFDNLGAVIKEGDKCFESVATMCKASVVPHTWVFVDIADSPSWQRDQSPLEPSGLRLAAQVSVIRNIARMSEDQAAEIDEKLDHYRQTSGQIGWSDAERRQFTVGTIGVGSQQLWLHDIDLRLV